ncbi:META domain-containing protein [Flagellimonas nanhaiensis]|uniref:META domain-containing protein n=1 Tax=Flagellimonas nanhaiensis TaxID=2292706 RepID=A0A371JQ97_9FLAO|nr:META domain-containing protein [Allomuricauda nanhaiensis]RDY59646.1 META domain-containing protein [Allomuricauda nanhaiensis]
MKRVLLSLGLLLLITNCVEKKKEETDKNSPEKVEAPKDTLLHEETAPLITEVDLSYFRAQGEAPDWELSLREDTFELSMAEDTFITPPAEPIVVESSNLKMYRIKKETSAVDIIIAQKECTDSISGQTSPYTVTISFKGNDSEEAKIFEGCGTYIGNPNLYKLWVLEEINSKAVSKSNYSGSEFPNIEIHPETGSFSGFAGCNRMNGNLFLEKDVIKFSNIISTEMACPNLNTEMEFLEKLMKVTSFKFNNDMLLLMSEDQGNVLTFSSSNKS